jgi:hypothetical protein
MHRPHASVERSRSFDPPFCPYQDCEERRRPGPIPFRFRRLGFYSTSREPRIPRFLCLACRRTFSRQAFSPRYFLKRPDLLLPIVHGLQSGSSHRRIARTLGCAHSTVTRLSARLDRLGLLARLDHLGRSSLSADGAGGERRRRARPYPETRPEEPT